MADTESILLKPTSREEWRFFLDQDDGSKMIEPGTLIETLGSFGVSGFWEDVAIGDGSAPTVTFDRIQELLSALVSCGERTVFFNYSSLDRGGGFASEADADLIRSIFGTGYAAFRNAYAPQLAEYEAFDQARDDGLSTFMRVCGFHQGAILQWCGDSGLMNELRYVAEYADSHPTAPAGNG